MKQIRRKKNARYEAKRIASDFVIREFRGYMGDAYPKLVKVIERAILADRKQRRGKP